MLKKSCYTFPFPADMENVVLAKGVGSYEGWVLRAERWGSSQESELPLSGLASGLVDAGVKLFLPFEFVVPETEWEFERGEAAGTLLSEVLVEDVSGWDMGRVSELVFLDANGVPAVGWVFCPGEVSDKFESELVLGLSEAYAVSVWGMFDAVLLDASGSQVVQVGRNMMLCSDGWAERVEIAFELLALDVEHVVDYLVPVGV